jgi:hypothetical protein
VRSKVKNLGLARFILYALFAGFCADIDLASRDTV